MEKIFQLHKETKFKNYNWGYAKYYDYPDGQDLVGKLSYTTKMAIIPSAIIGHINADYVPPIARTHKAKLFKFLRCVIPGIGVAATFTCVTYFATNIRKKDDPYNYLFGGLAAGSVVGFASSNPAIGAYAMVVFSSLAVAKKIAQLNGTVLFPPIKYKQFDSYYAREADCSLISNTRRGNWTRNPPPEED